ncbi:hypothetical protein PISL3812_06967 [Talaromyces islandicus]|uniref:BZIP domain-containing protein n=1 Tax=Talaromyces islandicus TaxID=28573 RepID=A0A0U1M2W4_TALIS|nr:hypothetical protein PISL3812_06967 [Talaromyces islandicus]
MTTILASTGSISCSYLDSNTSNHIFCAGTSGREYSVGNYLINDMSAAPARPSSGWRETHNAQSSRPRDHASSSAPPTTGNFISTSWSEDHSQLDRALADSIAFGLDPIILPDTNLIDLNMSLDDFVPSITEPRSPLSPTAASENSIGSQTRGYILENRADRHQSQSPSLLYQTLSAPQSQQHTHSPNPSRYFQPINRHQHSRQNTTVAESAGSDTPSSQDSGDDPLTEKRRRNKLAAQRLRQKKLDRISNLESRLEDVTKERDDLRLRLAKWEGEAIAMRQLFDQKMKE